MSRTDDIMKAVHDELERHRAVLDDTSTPVTSVGVLVLVSERTGALLRAICRVEQTTPLGKGKR